VIDLGSGDGRIIIEAAKRGARGLGVDIDPNLVKHAIENAQKAGVDTRTQFIVKDIFETDLSAATVVAFYLLPDFNAKLLPKLLASGDGLVVNLRQWLPAWGAAANTVQLRYEGSDGLVAAVDFTVASNGTVTRASTVVQQTYKQVPNEDGSLRVGYWYCGENPNNAVEKTDEGTSQFSDFTFTDKDNR